MTTQELWSMMLPCDAVLICLNSVQNNDFLQMADFKLQKNSNIW